MVETRRSRLRSRSDLGTDKKNEKESSSEDIHHNKPAPVEEEKNTFLSVKRTLDCDSIEDQKQINQKLSKGDAERTPAARKPQSRNDLSRLIPKYTAPMKLSAASLDNRQLQLNAKSSTAKLPLAPPAVGSSTSFKTGKRPAPTSIDAGRGWFNMRATPMNEQLQQDLKLIRNRNYLDPKRFYKSSDSSHKFVQMGTVVEGATEYYSSRLTKKQRKETFLQEVMADQSVASYAQNKYKQMQQEKTAASLKRRKGTFKRKGRR